VSAADLKRLTNQEDPIHKQPYSEQAKTILSQRAARTLQQHATRAGARRFKKGYTSEISDNNKTKRVEYGEEHKEKTLTGFWQWVWFTDEVHLLSAKLQNAPEYELRFPGQERRKESLKETKSSGLAVTIHIAAGVSYNHKGPLIFYKDPKEPSTEKVYKPGRPRKSGVQTQEEYATVVKE
jgi:hypothetical protein